MGDLDKVQNRRLVYSVEFSESFVPCALFDGLDSLLLGGKEGGRKPAFFALNHIWNKSRSKLE